MKPEDALKAVMTQLKAVGIDPITVSGEGLDGDPLRIRVKVRNREELARLVGLGYGWGLSVAVVVECCPHPPQAHDSESVCTFCYECSTVLPDCACAHCSAARIA